jgi:hypothetical protein
LDLYNRQLHPDEKAKIHEHANGDAAEEKKLTEAACYRVQCWAQYSPNSNEWLQNYVSPQDAAGLTSELSWVDSQRVPGGQFDYTLGQRATDIGLSPVGSVLARRAAVRAGCAELAARFRAPGSAVSEPRTRRCESAGRCDERG